jgi:hypothetical protein
LSLASKLTMKQIRDIAILHKQYIPTQISVANAQNLLKQHMCIDCDKFVSVLKRHTILSDAQRKQNQHYRLHLD